MNFDRRGLEIGPFDLFGLTINPTFHWYGLIIVTGILAATMLVAWMARREDKDSDHVWNGVIWVVVLAVIFARLWHVLFPSVSSVEAGRTAEWYLSHPFDLNDGPLIIWSGGLSIFGAVIGGAIGVLLYTWRHKLDVLEWLDMAAVAVPLGQAIGRWGNYVNEELYGEPTDLPWGLKIDDVNYPAGTKFHPLFLYESLWNLLSFVILLFLWVRYRDRFKKGDFVLLYAIMYGIARFFLEFLRLEVTMSGDINVSQAFSAGAAILSAIILVFRHRTEFRSPAKERTAK
ncbi:MAG TPA: prolipoprotein diacylglyceryl transferase [Aggregatilineaceae bacterium]|nr:prolipoprotein diacylglyceryl transferase [Aggregatilineaceae bacterium]